MKPSLNPSHTTKDLAPQMIWLGSYSTVNSRGVFDIQRFAPRSSIFTKPIQILGHADDLDIIGRSTPDVKEAFVQNGRDGYQC